MDTALSFLRQCFDALVRGVIALSVGFVLFSLMERIFRLSRARKSWRAALLDLQYALLSMFYAPFIYLILFDFFGIQSLRSANAAEPLHVSAPRFVAQLISLLLVRDSLIYLRHRIFHLRPVWAFHSVHHSSEEVDWLSAVRFHPAENLIEATGEIVLFFTCDAIGFFPPVLSTAALLIGFYNFFIHSNLRWTFGPLRYVFVSPVFHRWHHSDLPEAADKNFAAMFSCIDLAFGTFYMPKDALPQTLGLSQQEQAVYPLTLKGQLLYPLTKR